MILFSVVKPSVHVMDLHLASVVNNWCQPIACSIRRSSYCLHSVNGGTGEGFGGEDTAWQVVAATRGGQRTVGE